MRARRRVTLADFDPHRNGITAVRLGLALAVLYSHAFAIGAIGPEPLTELSHDTTGLGFTAVLAFFALSGFLLGRSRERTPLLPFVRNRALRILPGYWLSLLFVAFVAAPIAAQISRVTLVPSELASYVLNGPVPGITLGIDRGTSSVHQAFWGATINGSLWTLSVELLCYLLLAIIPARSMKPVIASELLGLLGLWLLVPADRSQSASLMLAFTLGVAAWLWRRAIPISWTGAVAALAVAGAGLLAGSLALHTVGIAYLALAAAWIPVHLDRDLSYGTYVLAYPVTVVLVMLGVQSMGAVVLTVAVATFVLPMAFLSWTLFERPALALRLRTRTPTTFPGEAGAAPAGGG